MRIRAVVVGAFIAPSVAEALLPLSLGLVVATLVATLNGRKLPAPA